MATSLLAYIAGNFISQYENVANSSICYLLNTYAGARIVLGRIIGIDDIPHRYVTELGTDKNGRPDVTGLDEAGNKKVIVEGKFWANLTDNQPSNYLDELGTGGALMFLAPERRLASLIAETKKRSMTHPSAERIFVTSWKSFIDSLEAENLKAPIFALTSDIAQLSSLCAQMDVVGMPPLSVSDLDPMNSRITYQLADLIDECRVVLRQWEPIDFKGLRATSWKLGYGIYFSAYGLGCQLFYSSERWFTFPASTPFWLTIQDKGFKKSDSILNTLAHWDPTNVFDVDAVANYAIHVRPGMDRRGAVEEIVEQVKRAIEAVIGKARLEQLEI